MSCPVGPAPKRRKVEDPADSAANIEPSNLVCESTQAIVPSEPGIDPEEMIQVQWLDSKPDQTQPSQELPAFRFYSPQPLATQKRLEQLQSRGKALIRTRALKHLFKKQEAAFSFVDTLPQPSRFEDKPWVFSFEKDNQTGGRVFVVESCRQFWKVYKHIPADRRCFYEVIRENSPCCLYFDVEFSRAVNPDLDGEVIMSILRNALIEDIKESFKIDISPKQDFIELDSSAPTKFSRHLIVRSVVFKNNQHMGFYLRSLMIKLYSESLSAAGQRFGSLFVPNDKGQRVSVVDLGVYSRNRNFRLFLSTKTGKNRPLIRSTSPINMLHTELDDKSLFFQALVCNIPDNVNQLLEFNNNSDIDGDLNALALKSSQAGGVVKKGDSLANSLFPEIDAWISNEVRKRPGSQQGYLRSWVFYQSHGLLVYTVGANRFCENIGREHKSNHVMIAVDFSSCTWQQRCLDPDCRALSYRSERRPIPPQVVCPLLGDVFYEVESNHELLSQVTDEELQRRLQSELLPDSAFCDINIDGITKSGHVYD